jgi:hypothetical protein
MFAANGKALIYGGDSAYPRTVPPLCDCVVLPSRELSLQGGATAAGAEAFHAVAPKSVNKNILRISPEPIF